MRATFKDGLLVLRPDDSLEAAALDAWKQDRQGHVLLVRRQAGAGLALCDLGPQPVACREPINVISTHTDPEIRILSNFAFTPFVLDGLAYNSVEGFWQGLKYDDPAERRRVALLAGKEAKESGRGRKAESLAYRGETIRVGSHEHWQLMEIACWAKFTQHGAARAALLATDPRPLMHRVRRDSRSIPGVIMADIWMRVRSRLQSCDSQSPC
jgi:predicted NAD-dependent protein-ADP-ribosyltransferase YbiA (DUF1768 family)